MSAWLLALTVIAGGGYLLVVLRSLRQVLPAVLGQVTRSSPFGAREDRLVALAIALVITFLWPLTFTLHGVYRWAYAEIDEHERSIAHVEAELERWRGQLRVMDDNDPDRPFLADVVESSRLGLEALKRSATWRN